MSINFPSLRYIERYNKIAEGGEACIHEYDSKTVIKLFKPKVDLPKKEKKVKFFVSINGQLSPKVIGPLEDVTVSNKFAAYIMKKLIGSEDMHMLTKPKYLTTAKLTNKDVLEIIVALGKELNILHSKGIIVGDVSDYNFQIVGKIPYLIDVDSWGVEGKFSPDAYTELFTCPDSYMSDGTIKFSKENENYNFAVLAFNMLTRIHPFGGTYLPDKTLSTTERMKRKISIVGTHKKDIKIPKIIGSWKWMSPELENAFIEIFEKGKKFDITPLLQELLNNMKYCSTHNMYYYSKFNECPLCNEKAKVNAAPVVTKANVTAKGPQITIVFSGNDCAYILSTLHYLNKNSEHVHLETGRQFKSIPGKRVHFSNDGKFVYVVDDDTITIYNEKDEITSKIERMHKSNYTVKDKTIYYIDKGNNFVKLKVTKNGNLPSYLGQVYNPLIGVSENEKTFVASMYPKTTIVTTSDYTFEVNYRGKIKEYAIKYDSLTNKWLFVYQLSNGKYRTMVFNKNKIEYDDDVIMYNADTLSSIDFYNNIIYDPSDGKIIGTNIVKNTAKEFACNVVDESSKLKFTGRGFKIYNKNQIYNYG